MLVITTPRYDTYYVDENGCITRDIQYTNQSPLVRTKPSGEWKLVGVRHVRKNIFIPLSKLTQEKIDSIQWLYKNGNPQYTVVDLDHGTHREWGNTKYHGIKWIRRDDL